MNDLNLALIGNCNFSSLIDQRGRIVWCCLPRFDGDPVFCHLLNNGDAGGGQGFFDIDVENFAHSEQQYLHNTAILITTIYDSSGQALQLIDFAPRFKQFGRIFRPVTMVRQIRPLVGTPRIHVRLRPTHEYGAERPTNTHGSNHIRYVSPSLILRLTTDVPVSFVLDETPFLLDKPYNLMLGPDEPVTQSIADTARDFYENTHEYWREWSRYLSVPFEWQEAVIRAAITLKLSSFEESGAIIAAPTTSLPESADTERNWDYRFCWLRDSYFVVHALNRLGATRTMEEFMGYILNIVAGAEDDHLQPVYGIALETRLDERRVESLKGYRGMAPVRVGNLAYAQVQNDVYGSVILATTQSFFDQRIEHPGDQSLFERLERLGEVAAKRFDQPDAGLWELRNTAHVHTYSSVMCWAACDRLAKIATRLELRERSAYWRAHADRMRKIILKRAWNKQLNSFVSSFEGTEIDASLLLMHELGFIEATDKRFVGTVAAMETSLRQGDYMFRYAVEDDFGHPENAFNICTFWYIDALAALGKVEEARRLFENMLSCRNHVGLLSEDLDPATGELWGNFPQTYSMVGLINSAMRLSKTWEEAF
jgi:pentatricopeptide repeat protein